MEVCEYIYYYLINLFVRLFVHSFIRCWLVSCGWLVSI